MQAPTAKKIGNAITFAVLDRLFHCGAFCGEAVDDLRRGDGQLFDLVEETVENVLASFPITEMKAEYDNRDGARESVIKKSYAKTQKMPAHLIRLHEYADELISTGKKQVWHKVGVYNRDVVNKEIPNQTDLITDQNARTSFKNAHESIWPIVKRKRALERLRSQTSLVAALCRLLPDAYGILDENCDESEDVKLVRKEFEKYERLRRDAQLNK